MSPLHQNTPLLSPSHAFCLVTVCGVDKPLQGLSRSNEFQVPLLKNFNRPFCTHSVLGSIGRLSFFLRQIYGIFLGEGAEMDAKANQRHPALEECSLGIVGERKPASQ